MNYLGKYNILGVNITACDYLYVVEQILKSVKNKKRLIIAPVASHPIVEAYFNRPRRDCLNLFDLIVPDSQYVRWAINFLYNAKLADRVYGPELFIRICKEAEKKNLRIFLYGNNIAKLKAVLKKLFPKLLISGIDLERKPVTSKELDKLSIQIKRSNCKLLFLGLSTPLQHEIANNLQSFSCPVIAVGAAFDFVSGAKPQAQEWMKNAGLEWFFRLLNEPQRLWKRYLVYGPLFIFLVLGQKILMLLNVYNRIVPKDKIVGDNAH